MLLGAFCIVYILAKNTVLSLAEILNMHVTHAHRGFLLMIRVPLSVFALLQSDYAGAICGHGWYRRDEYLPTREAVASPV